MIFSSMAYEYVSSNTGETIKVPAPEITWKAPERSYGKYDCAMAEYLDIFGDGDDETGSTEWYEHVMRFGRRLLFTDDNGFVTCERFGDEGKAKERFEEIDIAYSEWRDEGEEEGEEENYNLLGQ